MIDVMQRPNDLVFFSDPGHGWLRVPFSEVSKLKILPKISSCSYQSVCGKYLFLEEDCDMAVYLIASGYDRDGKKDGRSWWQDISDVYHQNDEVRNLPSFRPSDR